MTRNLLFIRNTLSLTGIIHTVRLARSQRISKGTKAYGKGFPWQGIAGRARNDEQRGTAALHSKRHDNDM
ncbi:MAG: hypothetical protein ACRC3G_04005 [Bacteroidales bacterium]